MPDIVLATLNARYIHASFGLRCLLANLGELQPRACIEEFVIQQAPLEIAEALLARSPQIVGFGVYIWNVTQTTEVVALLKRIRPSLTIILGGPEVSHETHLQPITELADHVITGEADLKFAEVCSLLLATPSHGHNAHPRQTPLPKIIPAELPPLPQLASPYPLYSDTDLKNRVLYVEASRGCPFTCEFCLSSLDTPVRTFELGPFLQSMQDLLDRGATQFKFVDRTFNLHLPTSRAILQFFLDRWRDGLFLHFEMVPDRLPEPLRDLLQKFPPGAVQLEVGIQTLDPATSHHISRRQNLDRLADNFRFLRSQTGIHIHADLIVGLPGETLATFGIGFDRLLELRPQEIQVGILKRLRGTPITRHDNEFQMVYSPHPPYEILSNRDIPFPDMQRMRRFARYWDLAANSGRFPDTLALLWENAPSPFTRFLQFSDWLHARLGRTHQIPLHSLARCLFDFLTSHSGIEPERAAATLHADWNRAPGREPLLLHPPAHPPASPATRPQNSGGVRHARRQARHTPAD